jgi:beta-glucosidase
VVYKEGVFVGYRGYEHNGVKPLFPFGYGLSYTTFKYSKLKADEHGFAPGATVAQVYVAPEHASVPRPAKELKGFSRVMRSREKPRR